MSSSVLSLLSSKSFHPHPSPNSFSKSGKRKWNQKDICFGSVLILFVLGTTMRSISLGSAYLLYVDYLYSSGIGYNHRFNITKNTASIDQLHIQKQMKFITTRNSSEINQIFSRFWLRSIINQSLLLHQLLQHRYWLTQSYIFSFMSDIKDYQIHKNI